MPLDTVWEYGTLIDFFLLAAKRGVLRHALGRGTLCPLGSSARDEAYSSKTVVPHVAKRQPVTWMDCFLKERDRQCVERERDPLSPPVSAYELDESRPRHGLWEKNACKLLSFNPLRTPTVGMSRSRGVCALAQRKVFFYSVRTIDGPRMCMRKVMAHIKWANRACMR
jgi:hypothetical protein